MKDGYRWEYAIRRAGLLDTTGVLISTVATPDVARNAVLRYLAEIGGEVFTSPHDGVSILSRQPFRPQDLPQDLTPPDNKPGSNPGWMYRLGLRDTPDS